MINRTNELVYVKRSYFFPFKPLLDYEYKKFGFKKCEVENSKKKKLCNTTYYVRHKERPAGIYDLLYLINLPFSIFRAFVAPVLVVVFIASMVIEGIMDMFIGHADLMVPEQFLLILAVLPAIIITVILSSFANSAYRRNETDGKTDRALASRGWDVWTSYKDNDPRFAPPGVKKAAPKANAAAKPSSAPANRNNPVPSVDLDEDDEIVTLLSANGEEIDFTAIALIYYRNTPYAILQPVELLDGMDDDEALVFKVSVASDGSNSYEIELDDAIIDAVFKEYGRLLDQAK